MKQDNGACEKCGCDLFKRTRSVGIIDLKNALAEAKKARCKNEVAWCKENGQRHPTVVQLAHYAVDAVLVYEARSIAEHVEKCEFCDYALSHIKNFLKHDLRGYLVYEPFSDLSEEKIISCAKCGTKYSASENFFVKA